MSLGRRKIEPVCRAGLGQPQRKSSLFSRPDEPSAACRPPIYHPRSLTFVQTSPPSSQPRASTRPHHVRFSATCPTERAPFAHRNPRSQSPTQPSTSNPLYRILSFTIQFFSAQDKSHLESLLLRSDTPSFSLSTPRYILSSRRIFSSRPRALAPCSLARVVS